MKETYPYPYFVTDSSSPGYVVLDDLDFNDSHEGFDDVSLPSIFTSYDIANEIDFLRDVRHLPLERRRDYLESNIKGFVSEFAGKVPHKTISGILTVDGNLEIAGFDMGEMMRDTAELAGPRSREWHERQGMKEVYKRLMDGYLDGANRVAWVSPSKSRKAKYGMVMYFELGDYDEALGGLKITERIIRYDEQYGNFAQSRRIYASLNGLAKYESRLTMSTLKTDRDFLLNPVAFAGNAEIDDEILQSTFGYSREDVEYVHHFEETVQRELRPLINTYTSVALALSEGQYDDPELGYRYLEDVLGAIFNGARIIHEQLLDQQTHVGYDLDFVQFGFAPEGDDYRHQIMALRDARPLVLEDGSNCDVPERYVSVADIYLGLSHGLSVQNILEKKSWKYSIGKCRDKKEKGCGRKNVLVGPCQFCKSCEKRIEEEGLLVAALTGVASNS